MLPRLIVKPAFTVIGLSLAGDRLIGHVDALWDRLSSRYPELPHADPDVGFGVHTWQDAQHQYLAGLALRRPGPVPLGMASLDLKANLYAVFPHLGRMDALDGTLAAIFHDWLPDSGYRRAGDYYFEYFDDRFNPGSSNSLLFIYLPVARQG